MEKAEVYSIDISSAIARTDNLKETEGINLFPPPPQGMIGNSLIECTEHQI